VDDDRRLLEPGQPVLDAVGEHRARADQELAKVAAGALARGQRHQAHRLVRRVAHRPEDLAAGCPPPRVDRRPDEHHRVHPLGPSRRELGDDLAPHRVRDERGSLEADGVEPAAERLGVVTDDGRHGRLTAAAVARKVGHVRRALGGEDRRERQQVPPGHAVAVDEHYRRARPPSARVHADAGHLVPAALQPRKRLRLRSHPSLPSTRANVKGEGRSVDGSAAPRRASPPPRPLVRRLPTSGSKCEVSRRRTNPAAVRPSSAASTCPSFPVERYERPH
jgi:hypothetical protein